MMHYWSILKSNNASLDGANDDAMDIFQIKRGPVWYFNKAKFHEGIKHTEWLSFLCTHANSDFTPGGGGGGGDIWEGKQHCGISSPSPSVRWHAVGDCSRPFTEHQTAAYRRWSCRLPGPCPSRSVSQHCRSPAEPAAAVRHTKQFFVRIRT